MPKQLNSNLSGGMNTLSSPFMVKPSELVLGRNIDLDKIGSITKRRGYSTGYATITGKEVLGLHQFIIINSGLTYLLAVTNNTAGTYAVIKYSNDLVNTGFADHGDTNLDSSNTKLLANAKYEFANFIDLCFVVGATSSSYNKIFTISGVGNGAYDENTYLSGAPSAKYIIECNERLFLANTSNSKDQVFFSDYPTGGPGTWALGWTATNNFNVNTHNGEEITGLGKNFNRVLVFKTNSIHKYDPETDEVLREDGNVGCSSHRSIKNLGDATYFYRSGYGFYEYKQGEPQLISRKIDDWVKQIQVGLEVCAEVDDRHYYAFVGDIKIDGRMHKDAVLVYDFILQTWSVLDNIDASVATRFGEAAFKSIFVGRNDNGKVHELFEHSSTSSSTSSTSSTSSSTSSTSSTSSSTSSTSSTSTSSTISTSITTQGSFGVTYMGFVHNEGPVSGGWPAIKNATSGKVVGNYFQGTATGESAWNSSNVTYGLMRGFLSFDTSSIPDGAIIISATLSIYAHWATYYALNYDVRLVQGTQASATTLTVDDFDACGTAGDTNQVSAVGWQSFSVNTTWISKTGYTKLALRNYDTDIMGNAPANGGTQQAFYNQPTLTVVYAY